MENSVCILSKRTVDGESFLSLAIDNIFINEQKVKKLYPKAECGPSIDELVFQCENIEITHPTPVMGWKINFIESQHSRHVSVLLLL